MTSMVLYGQYCPMFDATLKNIKQAEKMLNCKFNLKIITNTSEIKQAGIYSFPTLVINEKIVAKGKTLSVEEIILVCNKKES